jgi:protein SCO1
MAVIAAQTDGNGSADYERPRRARTGAAIGLASFAALLAGCSSSVPWHGTDITGSLPVLAFTMSRASDGKTVTAADYRGKVTLLYFGYTFCPDVCPLTLSNVGRVLQGLGPAASRVRVLFVTVDPDRDNLSILKRYAAAFGPQVDGLRGDPDELTALARRYRVAYSVSTASPGHAYEVTHSSGIYVFDRLGKPRLIVSSLSSPEPDVAGTIDDLHALLK